MKKKLKMANQKIRRNACKLKSMKELISQLTKKKLIETNCQEVLEKHFSGVSLEMLKRITNKSGKGVRYSPALRSFALTLQFYSTKAYEYVRRTFDLSLPHQRQIRRWYSKIQADPGFTEASFAALMKKVEDNKRQGHPTFCSLVLLRTTSTC